jgi:Tol biopolymer transport system component
LADETRLVTCPVWAPDGRYLYYCSALRRFKNLGEMLQTDYRVKYDLMRIAYDLANDRWGQPETILSAGESGLSVAQPRLSPDGRWLTFCLCEHSCWPTYHPESDIYAIDLEAARGTGRFAPQKMGLNSDACESWHCWSRNSRWLVFSSKRGNPLFNRPHLAHVDATGKCSKPFVVPQQDPAFYDAYLKTYTIPQFATGPLRVSERKLVQAVTTTNNIPRLSMPEN